MDSVADFILILLIGFGAQMIDGALGMGFGVISSSFLLVVGYPPALASSSVHLSKILTNGASGLSHWRFGNVDRSLLRKLLPAGVIGGVLGAFLLTMLPHGVAKPIVAVYLFITGLLILWRAFHHRQSPQHQAPHLGLRGVGALGGFVDAIGGGGWGPIVTSTLLARRQNPRHAIGTSSLAEFFVALAISATFFSRLSIGDQLQLVLGLSLGGVIAAPLAAYLCGRLPPRTVMFAVGTLVLILSVGLL